MERFVGDGLLVILNDPVPQPDHSERGLKMALAMRAAVDGLAATWRSRGHDLGFGVGIACGYATLGSVGFEHRLDYAAIGTVPNLASRLSDRGQGRPDPDQPAHAVERSGTGPRRARSASCRSRAFIDRSLPTSSSLGGGRRLWPSTSGRPNEAGTAWFRLSGRRRPPARRSDTSLPLRARPSGYLQKVWLGRDATAIGGSGPRPGRPAKVCFLVAHQCRLLARCGPTGAAETSSVLSERTAAFHDLGLGSGPTASGQLQTLRPTRSNVRSGSRLCENARSAVNRR